MARTERFNSFAELEREKQRLDAVRRSHREGLERHWNALQDREVRGALLRDAAGDILHAWKPARLFSAMFGGGSVAPALTSALLGRGGMRSRLLRFVTSMVLPRLLERAGDRSVEDITKHLRTSVDRISAYLAERKKRATQEGTDA